MDRHASLTLARVKEAVERRMRSTDNPGFCLDCGHEHDGIEPDARGYDCRHCGQASVYGADELLMEIA